MNTILNKGYEMNRKYKLNKTPHQLWVDSQLWRAFKSRCAVEGKSMSGKIVEWIKEYVRDLL